MYSAGDLIRLGVDASQYQAIDSKSPSGILRCGDVVLVISEFGYYILVLANGNIAFIKKCYSADAVISKFSGCL